MNQSTMFLLEIMRKYPPYSVNSIVTGICACFSSYLDVTFQAEEKITPAILETKVLATIADEKLTMAFKTLCRFIANDDLLSELLSTFNPYPPKKPELKDMLDTLTKEKLFQRPGVDIVTTPTQLNQLCIAILKPINGSFYDGVAGIGSTAIDAALYAQKNGGRLELHTQEVNALCHAVAVVRAFLYKLDSLSMHWGDTLTVPKTKLRHKCNTLQTFDHSIMFPPFGLSWKNIFSEIEMDPYHRFHLLGLPPTSSADWLFVQHQFASLNENGKGIIALPTGALFNAATSKMREDAIRAGIIECIISLPSGMLPCTGIPISLMVIRGSKRPDAQILMIQTENLFADIQSSRLRDASRLNASKIDQICTLYRKNEQVAGASQRVDVDALAKNDWVLLPSRYIRKRGIETEHGHLIVEDPVGNNWLPLGSIGSFYRGINVAPSTDIDGDGPYKIINLADVQNGQLQLEYLTSYHLKANVNIEKYMVQPGDLLISCKGSAIKLCVVPPHVTPMLLSSNFIGIRIDQARFYPLFIKYFLESPVGQVFLQNKQVGTSIITLTARDLFEIPIPTFSLDEQAKYAQELGDAEHRIHKEIEHLYTQSKQAKWDFYQKIGLGKIMKEGEGHDGN